jgi:hypothetical protein
MLGVAEHAMAFLTVLQRTCEYGRQCVSATAMQLGVWSNDIAICTERNLESGWAEVSGYALVYEASERARQYDIARAAYEPPRHLPKQGTRRRRQQNASSTSAPAPVNKTDDTQSSAISRAKVINTASSR